MGCAGMEVRNGIVAGDLFPKRGFIERRHGETAGGHV